MLNLWDEVQPFPDVLPALKRQQEMTKVLIFSNVETEYLKMMVSKLEGFQPDFFGTMQDCQGSKPSPRVYRWVLEQNGFEAKDAIYCAGVQWDVQGAMAFGMKAAFLKRPHDKDPIEGEDPDYIVKDLHELTKIVESSILGS
jgi:2-haloacid dehalogenase